MFIDELHSIYELFTKYYKHQLQSKVWWMVKKVFH